MDFLVKDISKVFNNLESLNASLRTLTYPQASDLYGRQWQTTLTLLPTSHRDRHWVVNLFFKEEPKFRVVVYQRLNSSEEEHSFVVCQGIDQQAVEQAFCQLSATLTPLVKVGEVMLTSTLIHIAILPKPKTAQQLSLELVHVIQRGGLAEHIYWITVNQALTSALESPEKHEKEKRRRAVSCEDIQRAASLGEHDEIWKIVERKLSRKKFNIPSEILEQIDQAGFTPLMLAASQGYLETCSALLSGGCNPNAVHPETGDTALHHAMEYPAVVKLLCIYDADQSITNAKGETPLDRAKLLQSKGAKEAISVLKDVHDLRRKRNAYYESAKSVPSPSSSGHDTYLLSLDGGGVRVMVTFVILQEVEKRMKQLDPSSPPLASLFDYIAGTSAGGVAAILLGHAGVQLRTTGIVLMRTISDVLLKPKADRAKRMKELLVEYLGEETKMADQTHTKIIVTTTLANCVPPKLHLMCNYGSPRDGQKGPKERLAWEVAIASMAAPYYFPSFEGKFLDGGLMANNPTLAALTDIFSEAEREEKVVNLDMILSVGTGIQPTKAVDNVEFFFSSPFELLQSKTLWAF